MDNRSNEPALESFAWRWTRPWKMAALTIVVIALLLGALVWL